MTKDYYYEDNYTIDLDENGLLELNRKNLLLIKCCVRIDSAYRNAFNEEVEGGSAYLIKKGFDPHNLENIKAICKSIDKENSTHLAVSGKNKGDNKGLEIMAQYIYQIPNLMDRLQAGDPTLVNEISCAVKGVHKFSFASKFCTYVSRYALKGDARDNFSIYDNVLKDVLPYYAWKYLDENYKRRNKSNIETFKKNNDYKSYRDLIDLIREKILKKEGLELSREMFDRMLWYYYKGDKKLVDKSLELIK